MLRNVLTASALALVSASALAQTGTIQWNAAQAVSNGQAQYSDGRTGAICAPGTVNFIANGDTVSVLFQDNAITLGDYTRGGLSICNIVIPARIAKGYYIAQLTQQMYYGVVKTAGAEAKVNLTSFLAGFQTPDSFGLELYFPRGTAYNIPSGVKESSSDWSVSARPRMCRGSGSFPVNYKARIAISGVKDTVNDALVLNVDGMDIRFESTVVWAQCNLPQ